MANGLQLSILDFQHPGGSVNLACSAEEWGYKRFWIGEHHSAAQCANPILLGALLAGATTRIRLGSGGVSLAYNRVLRVAEDARLVEFMLPGRFDLGVTRGLMEPGPVAAALLEGAGPPADGGYPQRVRDLHALVTGRSSAESWTGDIPAHLEGGPPLWVLGLSAESAHLAGALGAGFCYSLHHAHSEARAAQVLATYRASFRASPEFPTPQSIAVVQCICAATEGEARDVEAAFVLPSAATKKPILGSPEQCAERLTTLAGELETDEIMIVDFVQRDQMARLEMYRLLADQLLPKTRMATVQPTATSAAAPALGA